MRIFTNRERGFEAIFPVNRSNDYEKKSTVITTNINFSNWDDIFMESIIANAILNRVVHHVYVVNISEKSYRLKNYYKESET